MYYTLLLFQKASRSCSTSGSNFPDSEESEPVPYLNTENGILQNVALKHSATEKSFEAKTMAFTSVRKLRARKIRNPFSLSQNNCGMDWIIWEIVVRGIKKRLWNPYCISAGGSFGKGTCDSHDMPGGKSKRHGSCRIWYHRSSLSSFMCALLMNNLNDKEMNI